MRIATFLLTLAACMSEPDTSKPDDTSSTRIDTDLPAEACASAELEAEIADLSSWTQVMSCGHIWFGVMNDDATAAFTLNLQTAQRSFEVGEQIEHDFGAPKAEVGSLSLQIGENVSPICTLAYDTAAVRTIDRSWIAVDGRVTVDVTDLNAPEGGEQAFAATVALSGVVLQAVDATGDRCLVPDASWPGVVLGTAPE